MLNLNEITVAGNVAKVEEFATKNGKGVNLTVAVNGSKDYDAEFVRLTAFGAIAENIIKYVTKGVGLYAKAHFHTSVNEKDGNKQYYTYNVIDHWQFTGLKKSE